ncbi:MAG TPA: ion channel [Bryobacteraceae bacterium]|nr:ion channel [Bryobacteraceae bacterium]
MTRPALHGSRFFLGILLLLLMLFPVLEDMTRPLFLIAVIASVFVAGVAVVRPGRSSVRSAIALAVIQIGLTLWAVSLTENSTPYRYAVGLALATTSILICYCIYCVLRYVLHANYITRDQIYAGISVYLMLGFAFGCIYYLMVMLDPGCFVVNTTKLDASGVPDLMYFSFITLATLGYGDVTPVARFARSLSQLEALAGTLYMAVFMARLVSRAGTGPQPVAAKDSSPYPPTDERR